MSLQSVNVVQTQLLNVYTHTGLEKPQKSVILTLLLVYKTWYCVSITNIISYDINKVKLTSNLFSIHTRLITSTEHGSVIKYTSSMLQ